MSDLNELGERVATAEERFRFINEVQHKHSERLLSLLNNLKAELDETRQHHARQKQEIARLSESNESLRGLLQSLLKAVETFDSSAPLKNIEHQAMGLLTGTQPKQKQPDRTASTSGAPSDLEGASVKSQPQEQRAIAPANSGGPAVKAPGQAPKQPKIPTFFLRDETASEAISSVKNV